MIIAAINAAYSVRGVQSMRALRNIKRWFCGVGWAGAMVTLLAGCANRLSTTTSPLYQDKITPVSSVALTGEGASIAFPAFIAKGYRVKDVPKGGGSPVERARAAGISFLAIVDPVGTEEAAWSGFYHFSMRVTETKTDSIVWSSNAGYGRGGVFINRERSTEEAMRDMVGDFSKYFPPR